ncbi:hypothetical protein A9R00_11340 [Oleispira antarctica]|uniref:Sel1 repeat family protein n=1 Tax=Oleispira antarctica TaxID=188908 RepID=A0A1Y5HIN4_OLEAN|nr:hypothetical protein A9R00_11340 [Oleispira antarctica]
MKPWLFLTTLLLSTLTTWADTKEFVRDYTYIAGEVDSKISARQMAMQEVKRELLNEIGTHIYSRIDISGNSKGETDAKQEIRAMTAGFVKVVVLEEKWNGYEFYIKAKMAADPEEILKRIKDLASNDEEKIRLKEQLNKSVKAFEDLRMEMLALKNALEESNSDKEKEKLALAYLQKSKDMSLYELYNKGIDYWFGVKGVDKNYKIAFKWFKKAADLGDSDAQFNLGVIYTSGKGVQQDYKEALYWYKKSADQGHVDAQFNLGIKYEFGEEGFQKNMKQAIYWYQKAADQGNAEAESKLGFLFERGEGVQQDYKEALYWYKKSADQGNSGGQFNLGLGYSQGRFVKKDTKQAFYWLQKAADQGLARAQFHLGLLYAWERGDDKQALYWLQKAADQGNSGGQFFVGDFYENGKAGLQQDHKKMLYWYQKSADQGYQQAIWALKRIALKK